MLRRCSIALTASSTAYSQTKLLAVPDIRGDRVVFTTAAICGSRLSGGTATRLTSHPGVELFARFSPDGKWIAFTGQYDGDEQVYVVPTTGGEPRQLTFYPARGPLPPRWGWENQVYGWSKDASTSARADSWSVGIARLYSVSIDGCALSRCRCLKRVPPTTAQRHRDGLFAAGARLSFREAIQRRPGQSSLHLRFKNRSAKKITNEQRATRDPMWVGDTIFYNSDRDGHFNLYAYNVDPDGALKSPPTARRALAQFR